MPYDYYSLPYCKPERVKHAAENLGEVLRGDRIENPLYSLEMRFDDQCKVQCRKTLSEKEAKTMESMIRDEYRVQMILDNLPVGMTQYVTDEKGTRKRYERGFPVGFAQRRKDVREQSRAVHDSLSSRSGHGFESNRWI